MNYINNKNFNNDLLFIGKAFEGANDENRVTLRIELACQGILKNLNICPTDRSPNVIEKPNFENVAKLWCEKFNVEFKKVERIFKGGK